ncbi:MAG TPA: hypothetical protein DDZ51_25505 [Planctomycetaceae bacterium]|nr:hypothetical protein [Planctomycetaceae bacterium]
MKARGETECTYETNIESPTDREKPAIKLVRIKMSDRSHKNLGPDGPLNRAKPLRESMKSFG